MGPKYIMKLELYRKERDLDRMQGKSSRRGMRLKKRLLSALFLEIGCLSLK